MAVGVEQVTAKVLNARLLPVVLVDVAVTCAPAPELPGRAIEFLGRFGRLNFFSGLTWGAKTEIDTNKAHYLSPKLLGTAGSSRNDYACALALVATGKVDVRAAVSPGSDCAMRWRASITRFRASE